MQVRTNRVAIFWRSLTCFLFAVGVVCVAGELGTPNHLKHYTGYTRNLKPLNRALAFSRVRCKEAACAPRVTDQMGNMHTVTIWVGRSPLI